MAMMHQNGTAEMALRYHDIIFTAVRTVDTGVVNVAENKAWERLRIYPVPLVRYTGIGTEGQQMMHEEFEAENDGVTIPTQVQQLVNPHAIRGRKNAEIAVS